MQFNPTDKSNSIIADIDFILFGTSEIFNDDYSLIDRTRNINIAWDEAVTEMYKADPNHKWDDTTNSDIPIATLNITGGLDHYTMLDSALVIHRVRMKDSNGTMRTLDPVQRRELTDSELNAVGSPSKYYKNGGVIFPVPVPNYSSGAGLEIEFQRGANHFLTTDTTKVPGFNPQFHQFLSFSAALRYAIANGMDKKIGIISKMVDSIRMSLQNHYQMRSPDRKPSIQLQHRSLRNTGLSYR